MRPKSIQPQDEGTTVNEFGQLYSDRDRAEDAVRFYHQAADIAAQVGDLVEEGKRRSNVAKELVKLGRFEEARHEIQRAIECKKSFGHVAESWKTFATLSKIERAVGNVPAAAQARTQAITAYLAYRRDGGEPIDRDRGTELCVAVAQAISDCHTAQVAAELDQLAKEPELPDYARCLVLSLQSILAGSRDRAMAAHPNLDFKDAAELHLLLDRLGTAR